MKRHAFVCLCLIATFLSGCATTKIEESWKTPGYSAPDHQKILVISVATDNTIRKNFESTFVNQLEQKGILAIPSHQWLPDIAKINKSSVRPIVKSNQITSVIVVSLQAIETNLAYQPAEPVGPKDSFDNKADSYFFYNSAGKHESGSYAAMTEYLLETNIFDGKTEKLSWSAKTRTTEPASLKKGVESVVSVVLKQAQKDKAI